MGMYGEADSQNEYNYAYGDEGMYGDELEPPPQDIYMAAYQGMGQAMDNEYGDPDDPDEDPYAGIHIDYEKIAKSAEKAKKRAKPAKKKPRHESPEEKSESQRSESERPEESKSSAARYQESERSESDIDRARVEETSQRSHDESSEAAGSGERIMNFQDLKRLHEDSDDFYKKSDALYLADQNKSENESDAESKPVELKPEAIALPNTKASKAKIEEDKAQDSYSYTFTNSQMEESSTEKISKTAKRLEDKAGTISNRNESELRVEEQKDLTPAKSPAEVKAEISADNYSYEDDFEQSSIPATSRDNRDAVAPTREMVEEKPEEESGRSQNEDKPMYWSDFKKSDVETPKEKESVPEIAVEEKPVQQIKEEPAANLKQKQGVTQVVEIVKKIRVEDKEAQTDVGPVQFADKSTRECLLEATVLEEKKKNKTLQAEIDDKEGVIGRLQENLKKVELEYITAQKQAATSGETVKRLMGENKDAMHQYNLLKIEKEDLIRKNEEVSIRLAELEKDKGFLKAECDKKIKIAEERAEAKSQKMESRAVEELQHNFDLEKSILQKQLQDRDEEIFYYKEKTGKLEAENTSLRLTNKVQTDAESKIRELQQENYVLQVKLNNSAKTGENPVGTSDAEGLRREIEVQETLIKGYQRENENMTEEIRQLKLKLKEMEALMYKENVRMREEQSKFVRGQEKVMVVDNSADVGLDVWNRLGKSNVMSVGELKSLKLQMDMLQMDKKRLEEQLKRDSQQAQNEVAMLMKQKEELESRIGVRYEDLARQKAEKTQLFAELEEERKKRAEETQELQGRIKWLTENQELVENNVQIIREKEEEIAQLKGKLKEIAENRGLRKSVRFADEAKEDTRAKRQVTELKKQLKDMETNYEAKLRSLQQQFERIKLKYEGKGKAGGDLLEDRIKALEQEKEDIKHYYLEKLKAFESKENKASLSNSATKPPSETGSLVKSFRKLLVIPEAAFLSRLLIDIQKLKSATESATQEEIDKTMEDITQALADVSEGQKDLVTRIIDKVMALGNMVTPAITDKAEVAQMIQDLETTLFKEFEKLEPNKAKNRYSASMTQEGEVNVDISTADFTVESHEKELCISVTNELQKWAQNSEFTIEYVQDNYDSSHSGRISPLDLMDAMKASDCPISTESLYVWMRRLEIGSDGKLDYVVLLDNLKSKNSEWWSQQIANQSVLQTIPKAMVPFIHSSIAAKLNCYFQAEPIDRTIKALQAYPSTTFTNKDLHTVLSELKLPLNHEDTAVIFNSLNRSGVVTKKVLIEFLINPKIQPVVKEAWGEEPSREEILENNNEPTGFSKTQKGDRWETKARMLYTKYKEMREALERSEKGKKDLEYKIQTICRDPKQKQILELQRKIESLEGVVRERDVYIRKTLGGTGELQMTMLRKNIEMEKAELLQIIANKNKEILMFKAELDAVLSAMERLRKKKSCAAQVNYTQLLIDFIFYLYNPTVFMNILISIYCVKYHRQQNKGEYLLYNHLL
eukprot:TRINITY_DN928_c9_g1_i1.p1 TRINITY_DN928_c9_g1~~TRINITY_DN928_c9_g1_i1.p1  ORF type:complete len:1496 (+),score=303.56 TRINITY_DN928_c9_g1_i1:11008-15495(+)